MTRHFNTQTKKALQRQERMMNDNTGANRHFSGLKLTAGPLALIFLLAGSITAYAAVTNSVTVTGTGPSGPPGGVTANANESVDVEDDAPTIAVVRSFVFAPGGDVNSNGLVDVGDKIVYRYVVTNSGNVTLRDVEVNDVHQAAGAPLSFLTPTSVTTDAGSAGAGTLNDSTDVGATADGDWDVLGPDDVVTFTSAPYTVVPGDFALPSSTVDNDIDGTVTASGDYDPGASPVTVNGTSTSPVPLNILPSLEISKVADVDTNVAAGQTVTYTYTVRNNGTVPITNITLADTHKGVLGALVPVFQSFTVDTGSTNTSNTITLLQPGDEAEYTATYIVTQADVDTLQ